jgi:hypothetical protein
MFDFIDVLDLDMDDDMYDNDVDREASVDYEEEQLRGGRRYDGDDEEEEEYVREGTYEGKSFPPKPSDWREIPANTIPLLFRSTWQRVSFGIMGRQISSSLWRKLPN